MHNGEDFRELPDKGKATISPLSTNPIFLSCLFLPFVVLFRTLH